MRYLDNFKYQSEYAARGIKPVVFFNANGSTAIFEGGDDEMIVKKWIESKFAKLKDDGFNLTPETFQKILEHDALEKAHLEGKTSQPLDTTTEVETIPSQPQDTDWKVKAIQSLESGKLKISELQDLLLSILKNL
jgi:hypothetical protein